LRNRTVLIGDVLEKIKEIPDESIDCEITSPPYFNLRDYGIEGQWGLEDTLDEYLDKMLVLMKEMKRVLKPTGSCWINMGDSYGSHRSNEDTKMVAEKQEQSPIENSNKSLLLAPWEFAIRCKKEQQWKFRNVNIWSKENAMPSSVKDRFNNKYEPIFFMVKQDKYYFNLDAVRVKAKADTISFNVRVRDADKPRYLQKALDAEKALYNDKGERKMLIPSSDVPLHSIHKRRSEGKSDWKKQDNVLGPDGKPKQNYIKFNERWKKDRKYKEGHVASISDRIKEGRDDGQDHEVGLPTDQRGKNPGDIIKINPKPFAGAHFAVFPIELPLMILKCSCPDQVCKNCGKPREPIIKSNNPSKQVADYENTLDYANEIGQQTSNPQSSKSLHRQNGGVYSTARIIGWTDCGCNVEWEAGIVLDPFFGSGTVGVAAEKLGLNWIGIELKEEYVTQISSKRLDKYNNNKISQY